MQKESAKVEQRKDESIAYSDGPVEDVLLDLVKAAQEVDSISSIAPTAYSNWPIRYHLSSMRANCIRHLNFSGLTVLEFGAGMGAISRYLAENCKALTVVEGTRNRFNVLSERLRDLQNWEGTVCNYQEFQSNKKFDVVCFFGVLEYAGKYIDADDPFLFAVSHAKKFLRPDGVILIAIENKNGLKYFSGCTEDHYARHFYGICGYPLWNDIKTFSKKEMLSLLEKCGLNDTDIHYLFPDYKLSQAVLTDEFIEKFPSVAANVSSSYPSEDYGGNNKRLFPEVLAFPSLTYSGLLPEMANSYLFISSTQDSSIKQHLLSQVRDRKAGAYTYSKERKHNVKNRIVQTKGKLFVEKDFFSPLSPTSVEGFGMKIFFNIPSVSPVFFGDSALYKLVNYYYYGSIEKFEALLVAFFEYIFEEFGTEDNTLLTPNALDALVTNCVVDNQDSFAIFDTEYAVEGGVRKSWFILRNCIALWNYLTHLEKTPCFHCAREAYGHFCDKFGQSVRFDEDLQLENIFQHLVTHKPYPEPPETSAPNSTRLAAEPSAKPQMWVRILAGLFPKKSWRKKVRNALRQ